MKSGFVKRVTILNRGDSICQVVPFLTDGSSGEPRFNSIGAIRTICTRAGEYTAGGEMMKSIILGEKFALYAIERKHVDRQMRAGLLNRQAAKRRWFAA